MITASKSKTTFGKPHHLKINGRKSLISSRNYHAPAGGWNTSCFLLSSSAKSLNDEFQNYDDFGLTSHLTSCSTNLSIYNTYVANCHSKVESCGLKSEISEPSSFTVKLLSHLEETQTLTDSTGLINFNYHAWPTIFNQDVIFDKHGDQVHSEGGSQPPKSDESDEVTKVEPPLGGTKAAAFKVSREYVSSDASEGFEDWSFLDQKRPYDSLVRENIFELLEDLEKTELTPQGGYQVEDSLRQGNATRPLKAPNALPLKTTSYHHLSNLASTSPGEITVLPTSSPEAPLLSEHLFSSEINKTYANRLRLGQRIKQFYGLSNLESMSGVIDSEATTSSSSSLNALLKLEDRLDIQMFRLKWSSSIANARQLLKHKHVGIITYKDRLTGAQGESNVHRGLVPPKGGSKVSDGLQGTKLEHLTSGAKEATANMFLGEGDLVYWRSKPTTNKVGFADKNHATRKTANVNSHKFPWLSYLSSDTPLGGYQGTAGIPIPGQLAEVSTVFALGTSYGSISLADELMSSLSHQMNTEPVYFTKAAKQCANPQKVSNYFEIHYKHAYCIRSSQSLKQEYLRLPQSSIHKDDWKSFLESSIRT